MSQYKLVALDMDGTLLNSKKIITPRTLSAIQQANQQGVHIVLNTGRCVAELKNHLPTLPEVRYLNCASGSLIYDLKEKKTIFSKSLSIDTVMKLLEISKLEKPMLHFLCDQCIVQRNQLEHIEDYNMGVYKQSFIELTTIWENVIDQYLADPFPIEKLNFYHTSTESRSRSREHIINSGLDLSLTDSEISSLEITEKGVDKGFGLSKLCKHLGISLSETIVIGDADNDLAALEIAGLSVAMENANEKVKAVSDIITADCDHDGCGKVIEDYILTSPSLHI